MPRKLQFGLPDALAAPFVNIASHSTLELHIPTGKRTTRSFYLATADITVNNTAYKGILRDTGAVKLSINRAADRVEFTITNVDYAFGHEMQYHLDDLYGAEAKFGRYWWQDANKEYHKVLLVGRVAEVRIDGENVRLTVVSDFYTNVNVGASRAIGKECGWLYKSTQCGSTSTKAACNKLLNSTDGCIGRHTEPTHRARYGGFAYMDSGQTVAGAAGLAAPAANQLVKTTSSTYAQRSAIQFVGATVTDDPVNNVTKVDYSATSLSSAPWIYVDAYGAVGDGVTDDRTAIQAALDAVPSAGGMVVFSAKTYYVSGAVNIKSNTTVMGMGYSTVLTCPSAGWALSAPSNFGILNITQKSNIRITNLRIRGTKSQSNINNVPKLIFMERYDTVKIDRCWFENSNAEGIWQGCVGCSYPTFNVTNIGLTIIDCEFFDIGYTGVTGFYDLTAIQVGSQYTYITNNRFEKVGTAVAGSGYHIVIANNVVYDCFGAGIGVGDSDPIGDVTITGNVIDIAESTILGVKGILCGHNNSGNTDYPINVVGNTIRLIGTGSGSIGRGIYVPSCQNANIADNLIEITARGIGLEIDTTGVVGGTSIVNLSNNVVRSVTETGVSYGFATTVTTGTTLKLYSTNNRVYGQTRANNSYPFYYANSSGTLQITQAGDWTEEGHIRMGSSTISGGYDRVPLFRQSTTTLPALATPDLAQLGKTLTGAWAGIDTAYMFMQNSGLGVVASNYAVAQSGVGQTLVNSATGQSLNMRIGNTDAMTIDSSRNVTVVGPRLNLTEQGSAPATPASGLFSIYPKTDGKLYGKNDAGTEYDLTAGTGASSLGWLNVKTDYGAVGDGTTNDTTAIQNAITAARTGNKTVYFPAGTYLVTGLTVTGAVRLLGDGPEASTIYSTSNAVIVDMTADGTDFFGGRIENLKIKGSTSAGSSQIGLKWDHGSGGMRFHARNLIIQDCGDHGFYWGLAFSSVAENIRITECADYPFLYNAPAQPTNIVDSMYVGRLRSGAVTAFRIKQGELLMRNCNGIDNLITGSIWLRVGRKNGVDGDSTDSGATVILDGCNLESFTSRGIVAYANSTIGIGPNCKFAGDGGTSAASKKAIEFTLEGDGSTFFSQYMPKRGWIDPTCDFNDGVSAYANNEPIHAAGFCPLEILGLGPGTGGGNQLTSYYNSASSSSQQLARADGRFQKRSITSTTTIPASAIGGYYEVDSTGGAVTLTLPWAGWYTRGQAPVYVVDVGGAAATNNITIQATSSTVNGSSTYVLNRNRQGVILLPNGDATTAVWRVIGRFDPVVGTVTFNGGASGDYFPRWNGTSGDLTNSSCIYQLSNTLVTLQHIICNTDNTYDLGAASSNRFRYLYAGTAIGIGNGATPSYKIDGGANTTDQIRIGRMIAGAWNGVDGSYAYFQNNNISATTAGNFAVAQNGSGATVVNSASGQVLGFSIANSRALTVDASQNVIIGSASVAAGTSAARVFVMSGSTAPSSSPADTVQAYVVDATAGAAEWYFRNELGEINRATGLACRNSSQFDKTSDTTLANVTGLSRNVEAGRAYGFEATLYTTSNTAGGIKCAIGGTATATSVIYDAVITQNGAMVAPGTTRATALATAVADVTNVSAAKVKITGTIVISGAGTLTVQFAQNASNGSASSVLINSTFRLFPIS